MELFLQKIKTENIKMINAAIQLHQSGEILPDTYLLDLDQIIKNAKQMVEEANKYNIKLFFMTKQIGRNPFVAKKLIDVGFHGAVCVDVKEALVMHEAGVTIAHVGHLVQIPFHLVEAVVDMKPEYITVYTLEKAKEINRACIKRGVTQKILLRIIGENDFLYPSQYGGFFFNELDNIIPELIKLEALIISGLTSFPCFLYDSENKKIEATRNVETLKLAQAKIRERFNLELPELNLPSATCSWSIETIAKHGGTQAEPGHGLSGTTPMHATQHLVEKPAYLYISEISHTLKDKSYCYGGGFYRRSGIANALVISNDNVVNESEVTPPNNESIDYHFELVGTYAVSSTVLMAFRTQIFVTRSEVAIVSGIQSGNPRVEGIYDSQGKLLRG